MYISLWPVFLAALAVFIIGWVWYSPRVFGAAWMRMSGVTPEAAERGKKRMGVSIIFGFLSALLMAWVMGYVLAAFDVFDWIGAVEVAFWMWAGFVATVLIGSVLWEQKPVKLYVLNAAYWLVSLVVMSIVLAL